MCLLACQVRVTIDDSGLCCVPVASFKHKLALFVDMQGKVSKNIFQK